MALNFACKLDRPLPPPPIGVRIPTTRPASSSSPSSPCQLRELSHGRNEVQVNETSTHSLASPTSRRCKPSSPASSSSPPHLHLSSDKRTKTLFHQSPPPGVASSLPPVGSSSSFGREREEEEDERVNTLGVESHGHSHNNRTTTTSSSSSPVCCRSFERGKDVPFNRGVRKEEKGEAPREKRTVEETGDEKKEGDEKVMKKGPEDQTCFSHERKTETLHSSSSSSSLKLSKTEKLLSLLSLREMPKKKKKKKISSSDSRVTTDQKTKQEDEERGERKEKEKEKDIEKDSSDSVDEESINRRRVLIEQILQEDTGRNCEEDYPTPNWLKKEGISSSPFVYHKAFKASLGIINYELRGDPSQPLVLTFHGLNGTHLTFYDLQEVLARFGYRTLTFDLYGHGLSSSPRYSFFLKRYGLHFFLKQTDELLQHLHLQNDRLSLVGFSMGCVIAAKYALHRQALVDRLCLLAPAGVLPKKPFPVKFFQTCGFCFSPFCCLIPTCLCRSCFSKKNFVQRYQEEEEQQEEAATQKRRNEDEKKSEKEKERNEGKKNPHSSSSQPPITSGDTRTTTTTTTATTAGSGSSSSSSVCTPKSRKSFFSLKKRRDDAGHSTTGGEGEGESEENAAKAGESQRLTQSDIQDKDRGDKQEEEEGEKKEKREDQKGGEQEEEEAEKKSKEERGGISSTCEEKKRHLSWETRLQGEDEEEEEQEDQAARLNERERQAHYHGKDRGEEEKATRSLHREERESKEGGEKTEENKPSQRKKKMKKRDDSEEEDKEEDRLGGGGVTAEELLWRRLMWQLFVKKGVVATFVGCVTHVPLWDAQSIYKQVGDLGRPVLLLWGEDDVVAPLSSCSPLLLSLMPNSTLVTFPRCSHLVLADRAQATIACIMSFLDFPSTCDMSQWRYVLPFTPDGVYVHPSARAPPGVTVEEFLEALHYTPKFTIRLPETSPSQRHAEQHRRRRIRKKKDEEEEGHREREGGEIRESSSSSSSSCSGGPPPSSSSSYERKALGVEQAKGKTREDKAICLKDQLRSLDRPSYSPSSYLGNGQGVLEREKEGEEERRERRRTGNLHGEDVKEDKREEEEGKRRDILPSSHQIHKSEDDMSALGSFVLRKREKERIGFSPRLSSSSKLQQRSSSPPPNSNKREEGDLHDGRLEKGKIVQDKEEEEVVWLPVATEDSSGRLEDEDEEEEEGEGENENEEGEEEDSSIDRVEEEEVKKGREQEKANGQFPERGEDEGLLIRHLPSERALAAVAAGGGDASPSDRSLLLLHASSSSSPTSRRGKCGGFSRRTSSSSIAAAAASAASPLLSFDSNPVQEILIRSSHPSPPPPLPHEGDYTHG